MLSLIAVVVGIPAGYSFLCFKRHSLISCRNKALAGAGRKLLLAVHHICWPVMPHLLNVVEVRLDAGKEGRKILAFSKAVQVLFGGGPFYS